MSSKIIFFLAVLITSLGVVSIFFDILWLEEYSPFSFGFFQVFLIGLGPTLFVAAYLRREIEREEGASTEQSYD